MPETTTTTTTTRPSAVPDEATGYSDAFSFEEAFEEARNQLAPVDPPHPDALENVQVTEIGSEHGGTAGLNRMYVKVARTFT
jgi:hypothetical protein